MKINVKLFFLTFTIISFVSVSSAFIYHTLAHKLLKSQQAKTLVNSANDFIFEFQNKLAEVDESFERLNKLSNTSLNDSHIDFIVETKNNDSLIINSSIILKKNLNIFTDVSLLSDFIKFNTNLIIRKQERNGSTFYYGFQINSKIISLLSEKIRAEIALVEGNVVTKFTNSDENLYYLPYLSRVTRELKSKNNFELITETIDDVDFTATHYLPKSSVTENNTIDFVIFNISKEASIFKSTMNLVTVIIVVSGILLTVIFLFLFTTKFRKQIDHISEGLNFLAEGNTGKRVKIISRDEMGNLALAFNKMLGEIEERDISEKEYSEFISLINQNPSLKEIGDATLQQIINSINIDAGALYLCNGDILEPISVIGLPKVSSEKLNETSYYKKAIDKKGLVFLHFHESHPIIRTGIAEFKINYLYILPIFYNNEIIAILELASINKPKVDIENYLNKIKGQLAIGLANGKAYSELKKIVEELKLLNNSHQEQNAQITKNNTELLLLHEQLKQRTQELEIQSAKAVESEKVKSQFLANMSHELRTPQNSILGLTELILKDEYTSPKTRERLNVVLRNGKKLLTLIENILEYSKLESGNTELKKSKIFLSELLDEVASFIKPLFLEREIHFNITPLEADYELYIDSKKVEQIIYNLVGNASKFTKHGFVSLSLEVYNYDLKIVVEDTGPGISEDDRNIIFDEFRQVDANLDRKFSGTGLGLTICKRYTELLGGKIEVESELGRGTNFKVIIPNAIKNKLNNIPVSLKGCKNKFLLNALIISDGRESIKLIKDYLHSYNISVKNVNSEQFDMNSCVMNIPDLIIIDILFENIDGWILLDSIKGNEKLAKIPVVVISMNEEANCGLGLNVYEYFLGSINKQNVHKVVENIEEEQSIKFRKLLFIMNEEKYSKIEDELIYHELKICNVNGKLENLNSIKQYEPDFIIVDLYDQKTNSIEMLTRIHDDPHLKSLPIVVFLDHNEKIGNQEYLNGLLMETNLEHKYHPLDVLKVIKDRVDLLDQTIFSSEQNTIASKNQIKLGKPSASHKTKVLIVDDDDDARFTIGEIVKSLGFEIEFASNGFECLEKLNNEVPDLVLLDIMMPKMDGFKTIQKIRENLAFEHLNVFALTAYAMLSDREIIEKNGFNGLFTKPINTIQFERKLSRIFKLTL